MGSINCYSIVKAAINTAAEKTGYPVKISKDKEGRLLKNCGKIDEIAEGFGGISLEADVDAETADLNVSLVCDEFEADSSFKSFVELMENAKSVMFAAEDDIHIRINFTFDKIWERVI